MFLKNYLYSLQLFSKLYGISLKRIQIYSLFVGSNPSNFCLKLKYKQNLAVKQKFNLEFCLTLKKSITKRLYFFWNIRLYRGIRHMLRLPSRGQRTHSNRNTKKKFKF